MIKYFGITESSENYRIRYFFILLSLFYYCVIIETSENFLSIYLERFGFYDVKVEFYDHILTVLLLLCLSAVAPMRIKAPSDAFIFSIYIFILVPTLAITACYGGTLANKINILVATAFFTILAARAFLGHVFALHITGTRDRLQGGNKIPFHQVAIVLSVILIAGLIYQYADVIRFVGISETYVQREAGKATGWFTAYSQTYLISFFGPVLMLHGLTRKNPLNASLIVSLIIFLLLYGIGAQKSAIIIPFIILGIYVFFDKVTGEMKTLAAFAALVAAVLVVLILSRLDTSVNYTEAVVLHRAVAASSLTALQYYNFFSEAGYTYWSHVKIFSAFVPAPERFLNDPLWPNLGYIIGQNVYGDPKHNVNANFLVSDGLAAAGGVGIILISVVAACWFAVIDFLSEKWDLKCAIIAAIGPMLSLINGPFFTVMLSFGGIAVMLMFLFVPTEKKL